MTDYVLVHLISYLCPKSVYNMGKLNLLASASILYARCNVILQDDYVSKNAMNCQYASKLC